MDSNEIRSYVQTQVSNLLRDVVRPSSSMDPRGAAVFSQILNQALGQPAAGATDTPATGAADAATAPGLPGNALSGGPAALLPGNPATIGPQATVQLAQAAGNTYRVSPSLVQAIISAESGGDTTATSKVGAMGLMQLMPDTAKALGVQDAYNPTENVFAGTHYLREMLDRYGGNVSLALAAYNAGPGAVDKYGGIPPYQETQAYVRHVLDLYQKAITP